MTPTPKPGAAVLPELPPPALPTHACGPHYTADQMQAYALAAIAASQAVVAVPGWQLVPVEPTPHMLFLASDVDGQSSKMSRAIWRAMLAAAPQPPAAKHPEKVDLAACDGDGLKAWILEYGAVDFPLGHPSRVTCLLIYNEQQEANDAAIACEYNCRVFPVDIPPSGIVGTPSPGDSGKGGEHV